jgi:hypothetical protein
LINFILRELSQLPATQALGKWLLVMVGHVMDNGLLWGGVETDLTENFIRRTNCG